MPPLGARFCHFDAQKRRLQPCRQGHGPRNKSNATSSVPTRQILMKVDARGTAGVMEGLGLLGVVVGVAVGGGGVYICPVVNPSWSALGFAIVFWTMSCCIPRLSWSARTGARHRCGQVLAKGTAHTGKGGQGLLEVLCMFGAECGAHSPAPLLCRYRCFTTEIHNLPSLGGAFPVFHSPGGITTKSHLGSRNQGPGNWYQWGPA